MPLSNLFIDITVSGRDNSYINVSGPGASQAVEHPFLYDPQDLYLKLRFQLRYFVQKKSATSSRLKEPFFIG